MSLSDPAARARGNPSVSSGARVRGWPAIGSVQVQSVLYNNEVSDMDRALTSLGRAVDLCISEGYCTAVNVRWGDSSPTPCLDPDVLADLRERFPAVKLEYDFFGKNLGSARGHNRLAEGAEADFVLIQNPNVIVSPRIFQHLLAPFARADVGMTEAKQLPIEHPKDYDPRTGETSWATTACAAIPNVLFR